MRFGNLHFEIRNGRRLLQRSQKWWFNPKWRMKIRFFSITLRASNIFQASFCIRLVLVDANFVEKKISKNSRWRLQYKKIDFDRRIGFFEKLFVHKRQATFFQASFCIHLVLVGRKFCGPKIQDGRILWTKNSRWQLQYKKSILTAILDFLKILLSTSCASYQH
jgi:hypothetical protein